MTSASNLAVRRINKGNQQQQQQQQQRRRNCTISWMSNQQQLNGDNNNKRIVANHHQTTTKSLKNLNYQLNQNLITILGPSTIPSLIHTYKHNCNAAIFESIQ